MANLFGPSPTEIMAARQKELEDRQQAEYIAMLETAKTPAERTYMMAGRTLSQAFSPLIGGGAGANDPMLQQARVTQTILSKYGPESFNDPDALSGMAKDFASFGMNNEAFQLAGRAIELRKNVPESYFTANGKELMELDPVRYRGLDPNATYTVNSKTGKPEKEKAPEYKGEVVEGYQAVYQKNDKGNFGWQLIKDENHPKWKAAQDKRVDSMINAGFGLQNVNDALDLLNEGWMFQWLDGTFANLFAKQDLFPSDAQRILNKIASINSNQALSTLAQLKTLSENGASGLGPVNIKEFEALQDRISKLNLRGGVKQLKQNLEYIRIHYNNVISQVLMKSDPDERAEAIQTLKDYGFIEQDFDPATGGSISDSTIFDFRPKELRD